MTAVGEGRDTAVIGPEWVLAMVPQGGLLAAIAARALAAELHVDGADGAVQPLRSIHGVFVSPVPAGPVVIDVQGRSGSQAQATVRSR